MITPRFEYTKLERETINGKRFYHCPDGSVVPSVTTILSATMSDEKKKILSDWRSRHGCEAADFIKDTAAIRGTKMHAYLEKYIETGSIELDSSHPLSVQGFDMAKTMIDNGLSSITEILGSEVPLYYSKLYAGTTDGVGIYKDNSMIIFDFKQSNRPKQKKYVEDYFLQLVFYGTAHNHLYGTKINQGVIMVCVAPKLDYKFKVIEGPHYQEFFLDSSKWYEYETMMWGRVEQFYELPVTEV